ncbi:MAG: CheR family methyltransferase [Campylobacterota bacterium]
MAKNNELVVVGIGASAGGLEALQVMLSDLADIKNCSYIIAQHLSPTHKSMMVDLLSRTANIPVCEAKNGMIIKPKTIYMTPENTDIYVKAGKIFLRNMEQSFGPKPSVNYFFNSLATSFGKRAIGVILSGTGSDGSFGIRTIKAEGGITIAQAPNTSKYDGMPHSAINTGKVDLVIPIDNLSNEIERIVKTIDSNFDIISNERLLQQIFRTIFDEKGVDFSLYKKSTVIRRIERRLAALKIESLSEYINILNSSKDEINNLYHDILIGVTNFFRDAKAFENLKDYIQLILSKKEQGEEIRFWSIGCSTGEEAYSIAIILSEALQDKISRYKIKIFATDIDEESLKIARTGVYSEASLEGVSKGIIQKYFSVQKNNFEVKKSIRELVVFSKHNIISDSPFLRLDLICCRNMLIYFDNELQKRFFPIVHYSLNDNGYLFLGKSESIGQHVDLFSVVDNSSKIFKAQFTGVKEPPRLYNYSGIHKSYEEPKVKDYRNEEELLEERVNEAISETILDKCVVINSSNDVIYIKGDIPYIKFNQGRMTNNIFKLISDTLSLDLRSSINEANKKKKIQYTPFRSVNVFEDIIKYVRVIVVPLKDDKSDDWMNILFFQGEEAVNIKGHVVSGEDESDVVEKLTLELDSTKSHLQNVIEELETSYEEMQSLNEELQSSNEELQSSNEELETTNEELQSTNEELQTAYSELRVLYEDKEKRAKQLEELTDKLSAKNEEYRKQKELTETIIDTATIAILMVDTNGVITFANNQAQLLFSLSKKELIGRNYDTKDWVIRNFDGSSFDENKLPFSVIKRTYEAVSDIKHVIQMSYNKLYLSVSGAPLFDVEGKFQGAVLSLENLTANEVLRSDLEHYENRMVNNKTNLNIANEDFDMLSLALVDITTDIRNSLNELVLVSNDLRGDVKNRSKLEAFDTRIGFVSTLLDEKLDFYLSKLKFKRTLIGLEIISMISLLKPVFENNSIEIDNRIDESIDFKISVKTARKTFYMLFEFIIGFKVDELEDYDLKLIFKSQVTGNKYSLKIFLEAKGIHKIDKNSFDGYFVNLEKMLDSSVKSSYTINKNSLEIKMVL